LLRQGEGVGQYVAVLDDQLRVANTRQYLDGKNLSYLSLEAQEGHRSAALHINDPHAADTVAQFHDRYAAELRRLPHLRQTDEGERTEEVKAPREAGQPRDDLRPIGAGLQKSQRSLARLQ